jgi:hypothetical protein
MNKGNVPHDFKIAGHKTKLLSPGQSQTLKVTFLKAGKYPHLGTVTGHAVVGMKGHPDRLVDPHRGPADRPARDMRPSSVSS